MTAAAASGKSAPPLLAPAAAISENIGDVMTEFRAGVMRANSGNVTKFPLPFLL